MNVNFVCGEFLVVGEGMNFDIECILTVVFLGEMVYNKYKISTSFSAGGDLHVQH
jgi:hypothetical protein